MGEEPAEIASILTSSLCNVQGRRNARAEEQLRVAETASFTPSIPDPQPKSFKSWKVYAHNTH